MPFQQTSNNSIRTNNDLSEETITPLPRSRSLTKQGYSPPKKWSLQRQSPQPRSYKSHDQKVLERNNTQKKRIDWSKSTLDNLNQFGSSPQRSNFQFNHFLKFPTGSSKRTRLLKPKSNSRMKNSQQNSNFLKNKRGKIRTKKIIPIRNKQTATYSQKSSTFDQRHQDRNYFSKTAPKEKILPFNSPKNPNLFHDNQNLFRNNQNSLFSSLKKSFQTDFSLHTQNVPDFEHNQKEKKKSQQRKDFLGYKEPQNIIQEENSQSTKENEKPKNYTDSLNSVDVNNENDYDDFDFDSILYQSGSMEYLIDDKFCNTPIFEFEENGWSKKSIKTEPLDDNTSSSNEYHQNESFDSSVNPQQSYSLPTNNEKQVYENEQKITPSLPELDSFEKKILLEKLKELSREQYILNRKLNKVKNEINHQKNENSKILK
ncbi:hypothetical protein M0813_22199 [Anaeramoeba flamelloides]|uniref:Uncharacterized protein n=1 Tax=Anaeramoeba flamelloides TaxID=1746091 RepID=A0ABQ8YGN6_9EUKA|nr:hypothetical protein M0813_22199 [Anaeramoeba flamelloides]